MNKLNNAQNVRWWEKAIVALLLLIAVIYGRFARAQATSAQTLQALARIHMARGDFDDAESILNNALASLNSEDDEQKSSCLADLAWTYKNQGRLDLAARLCEQALFLQRQIYYCDHPYIAYTLRIMGSIYLAQRKFPEADQSFGSALAIIRKCHLSDDPAVASFEVDNARLLAAQGKLKQAEIIYRRAYSTISGFYGSDNLYAAGVLADIAKLYHRQNRLVPAAQTLEHALAVQEKFYDNRHPALIANRLALIQIYIADGRLSQASWLLIKTAESIEAKSENSSLKADVLACVADLYLESDLIASADNPSSVPAS